MKTKIFCLLTAGLLLLSCSNESELQAEDELFAAKSSLSKKDKKEKVAVCHYDSETDEYKTLNLPQSAVNAHLNHGDYLGECKEFTYVPDDFFEQILIDRGFDDVLDDYVLTKNIRNIESLIFDYWSLDSCCEFFYELDLTGIEDFLSLRNLSIRSHPLDGVFYINSIPESIINNLSSLSLFRVDIEQPLILRNTNIEDLFIFLVFSDYVEIDSNAKLTGDILLSIASASGQFIISNNPNIETITFSAAQSGNLKILNNDALEFFYTMEDFVFPGNIFNNVHIEGNDNLTSFEIFQGDVQTLEIVDNPSIERINLTFNKLSAIDLTNLPNLTSLLIGGNKLANIDLSNSSNIRELWLWDNQLANVDVSGISNLDWLWISGNPLTCIQVNEDQLNNVPLDWIKDAEDVYSLDCSLVAPLASRTFQSLESKVHTEFSTSLKDKIRSAENEFRRPFKTLEIGDREGRFLSVLDELNKN